MTGLVALSEKAWLILKPFIDKSVEALPLQSKEGTFFVINVLKRPKLNLSKSEVSRFSDGGIIRIQKYAFVKSSVSGKNIFIPEEIAYSKPIITEDLKKIIEENKLKGLIFKEIWDSEV